MCPCEECSNNGMVFIGNISCYIGTLTHVTVDDLLSIVLRHLVPLSKTILNSSIPKLAVK